MTEVFLPSGGVEQIEDRSFAGCTSLTRIFIPKTLKKIGRQVFYGCEKLEQVDFEMHSGDFDNAKKVDRGGYAKGAWMEGANFRVQFDWTRERWDNERKQ